MLGFLTWERDLFDADEGRYATVARTMWATGDWVVPRLDDMPFMDKPPLVYWIQATCYTVFGPSAFFARLPTVLAGSLWCLLLFLFARRLTRDEGVAWIVGLAAATSAAGCIGSRVGPQMDMPLAAAIATARSGDVNFVLIVSKRRRTWAVSPRPASKSNLSASS